VLDHALCCGRLLCAAAQCLAWRAGARRSAGHVLSLMCEHATPHIGPPVAQRMCVCARDHWLCPPSLSPAAGAEVEARGRRERQENPRHPGRLACQARAARLAWRGCGRGARGPLRGCAATALQRPADAAQQPAAGLLRVSVLSLSFPLLSSLSLSFPSLEALECRRCAAAGRWATPRVRSWMSSLALSSLCPQTCTRAQT